MFQKQKGEKSIKYEDMLPKPKSEQHTDTNDIYRNPIINTNNFSIFITNKKGNKVTIKIVDKKKKTEKYIESEYDQLLTYKKYID
jgi:hypothetical protein